MKKINHHVDHSYFRIQNLFNNIIKVNKDCLNKLNHCEEHKTLIREKNLII